MRSIIFHTPKDKKTRIQFFFTLKNLPLLFLYLSKVISIMAKRKTNKSKKSNSNSKVKNSSKYSLKKYLPLALITTVLGFLLYCNTFQHDWALDDYSVIKENWVTQQGFGGIGTHLTHSYRHGYGTGFGTLYRPLSPVMFAMEWGIAPDSPGFMHFVNALFYALTGFVLFFTL